jgi:hypothetical protein
VKAPMQCVAACPGHSARPKALTQPVNIICSFSVRRSALLGVVGFPTLGFSPNMEWLQSTTTGDLHFGLSDEKGTEPKFSYARKTTVGDR